MKPADKDQDDLIIRYLLGEISQKDRELFEEGYFSDDHLYRRLQATEQDLIDWYVRGEMSASQRDHFESHFMAMTYIGF